MARTEIRSGQIKDSTVNKDDIDVSTTGKALVTKIIAGTNITLGSTGVDAGTGDVTVNGPTIDATPTDGSNNPVSSNGVFDAIAAISGGGMTWTEVTGTSQSAAVDNGYITNNASLVTVTIPTTAAVGKVVRVAGKGAGGWKVAQNASENIRFGNQVTTTGTGGYLASSNQYDCVELLCTTADTSWLVISSIGNITIV